MTEREYNTCVARWTDDVMRFAVSCRRSDELREDCEDAVQEAFAALWNKRDAVDAELGKSFLFSAVRRQMLWAQRRQRMAKSYAAATASIPHTDAQPDTSFDAREAINAAFFQLSDERRAVLHLRDVEGYSYNEIASMLDMTTDQVQVNIFRARVSMRKYLKQIGYDNDR